MNLTLQETAWLRCCLEELGKKMPGGRSARPFFEASLRDLDDLFRSFREEATWGGDELWQAVLTRGQHGIWPKLKPSRSYWLRQRWLMAECHCREVLASSQRSGTPIIAQRPAAGQAALRWLLIEMWDKQFVDVWIRDNARDCVSADPYKSEEGPEELERYFLKHGYN